MYWNGSTHVLYNSLKRIESGGGCANNVRVTVPGIWKSTPKIIVSPHSLQTFNKNYAGYNQKINCEAQGITRASNGVVQFTPVANLSLSDGVIMSNPNAFFGQLTRWSRTAINGIGIGPQFGTLHRNESDISGGTLRAYRPII
jgi:hypothetical protein